MLLPVVSSADMQTSADEHIVASIPSIDDDFQPENEISEEVLNMLLIWQKKNKASLKNEAPATKTLSQRLQPSAILCAQDMLQPPRRYYRTSKHAHMG